LLLGIPEALEKTNYAIIGRHDLKTGEKIPLILIQKIQGKKEIPGARIIIDFLTFKTEEVSITIPPAPFYSFVFVVKNRLGNENPLQYQYAMTFTKHFIEVIAEVPKIYREKGKLVKDIEEIGHVFSDYQFHIQKMAEFLKKELISGPDKTKQNKGV